MASNTPANSFSIFSLIDAIRRRKLLIILPTLLLGAGFALYAYKQPDMYRAKALIAAEHTAPPEYLKHVAPPVLNIKEHLWTVREVLYSAPVLESAAREIEVYRGVDGPLPAEALEALKSSIKITIENEHTFNIVYDGRNREETMKVTNRLADLFVESASATRERKVTDAANVIDEQLDALKKRLETQSRDIHAYKQGNVRELPDHVDANIRREDMLREQYLLKETKINEDEARRTAVLKEVKELEAKGALEDPMIPEKTPAELKLNDLQFKYKEMKARRYTPRHPDLLQLESEIRDVERQIASQPKPRSQMSDMYQRHVTLKAELESIDQRVAGYRREQHGIASQISGYRQQIAVSPKHERALEDMKREYEIGEQQLHALLDKRLDSNLAKGLEKADSGIAFQVVEPAMLPPGPFSPQRERLILLGFFTGLGLGLVMAFVIEQNDTTFGNVDEFQSFTSLPAAGIIPTMGKKDGIVTMVQPDSVAAEQYGILALRVQQQLAADDASVLLITSAAGAEGKSMTAINLTVALSSTVEGPVLLVDADMRKPRLHEYLDLNVTPGRTFQELLLNPDDDPNRYVVKLNNLNVIPGSSNVSNPVALLASPRARLLVNRLKQTYRIIVIDAPPTLPIADSHILSSLSDKVLFVVRARKTPRELFQHAVESIDAQQLIGAVLNDVDYERSRYAYAYQYYKEKAR